jgi:hypothetical protein
MSSHSSFIIRFQNWISKVVYTHHLGTQEQRREKAKTLLGKNCNNFLETLSIFQPQTISAIYYIFIGKASEFRQ